MNLFTEDSDMKFFSVGKSGGPESNVTGYWAVEIKPLFSVVLLKFDVGTREWKPSIFPKYTPKSRFHKVYAKRRAYALNIRGPWEHKWQEYSAGERKFTTLTHGRKEVPVVCKKS